jgi:hypothetical protein
MNVVQPIDAYRAELRSAALRRVAARRRRLLTLFATAAVGVLTASLALAASKVGWLTGSPAPPHVVTGFEQYTPQLGFHPEAGKAQFVAQDGPIKLYTTSNREGGICYLVDEPWKPANAGEDLREPGTGGGADYCRRARRVSGRVRRGRPRRGRTRTFDQLHDPKRGADRAAIGCRWLLRGVGALVRPPQRRPPASNPLFAKPWPSAVRRRSHDPRPPTTAASALPPWRDASNSSHGDDE